MPNARHKYGNASRVTTHIDSYADGGPVRKKGKKAKKKAQPKPEMLGSGAAARAGSEIQNRRAQQMKDLGL